MQFTEVQVLVCPTSHGLSSPEDPKAMQRWWQSQSPGLPAAHRMPVVCRGIAGNHKTEQFLLPGGSSASSQPQQDAEQHTPWKARDGQGVWGALLARSKQRAHVPLVVAGVQRAAPGRVQLLVSSSQAGRRQHLREDVWVKGVRGQQSQAP